MCRQAFGTHMVYRETFLQVQLCFPQHVIRRNLIHGVQPYQNRFTHQRRRRTTIQSSQVREILQRNMEQTNNDCRYQIFISTNSSTPATYACWKIRFKIEVCTCSQFPTEGMLWIKEVEMVNSVDDSKSSSYVRGIRMPDFEVLDVRIASALNRIIHNSHSKRRVSLEEQKAQIEDRFLHGRQIAYLIYEYFRVFGANDSVENYADLFTIGLRYDDIQEFDSKLDGILF